MLALMKYSIYSTKRHRRFLGVHVSLVTMTISKRGSRSLGDGVGDFLGTHFCTF